MATADTAHDKGDPRCPECGRDPRITRARPAGISHRAALIAVALWGSAVLLTLAYTLPWTQAKLGKPFAIYSSTSSGQLGYSTTLTPGVSVADIRDHERNPEKIRDAIEPLKTNFGRWWADAQIRFVLTDRRGMRYDQRSRGFAGVWISEYANTHLLDVTHEPAGNGPWTYPIEAVQTGFFYTRPTRGTDWFGLRTETTHLDGGQWYRRTIHPFQLLISVVSLTLTVYLALRLLYRVLRRWDRVPQTRPLVAWCLIAAFLIGYIAFGYSRAHEYHHIAGMDIRQSDPARLGPWIESDEFERLLLEPDQEQPLIDHLLTLCEDHPPDLLLGYQTKRDSITQYNQLNAQLGYNAELIGFGSTRFLSESADASLVPAQRPGYLKPGLTLDHAQNWETFWIQHNGPTVSRHVSIYWARLIFAGFLAWALLRGSLRGAHLFVRIPQRKRVKRNQCIFCAYPLDDDAVAARTTDPRQIG